MEAMKQTMLPIRIYALDDLKQCKNGPVNVLSLHFFKLKYS